MPMVIIAGLSLIGAGTWLKGQQYEIESQAQLAREGVVQPTGPSTEIDPAVWVALALGTVGMVMAFRK